MPPNGVFYNYSGFSFLIIIFLYHERWVSRVQGHGFLPAIRVLWSSSSASQPSQQCQAVKCCLLQPYTSLYSWWPFDFYLQKPIQLSLEESHIQRLHLESLLYPEFTANCYILPPILILLWESTLDPGLLGGLVSCPQFRVL